MPLTNLQHTQMVLPFILLGLPCSERGNRTPESGGVAIGEKPLRRPNYSSFARYFHWFKLLGLIERTERKEPAIYDFLQRRVFYILTARGESN